MMRLQEDRALLDRLYARLTEALRERPDPYGTPVTVAELYQELVPYRSVRGDVGFSMNADYEHTLLRLLSGEGELAKLEPPGARDEIRRELRSSNPNVSIYREYAACEVSITPPAGGVAVAADEAEDEEWSGLELLGMDPEADDGAELPAYTVLELTEDEIDEPAAAAQIAQNDPQENGAEMAEAEGWQDNVQDGAVRPRSAGQGAVERGGTSAAEAAARYAAAQQEAIASLSSGGSCVFCDSRLPSGRKVRYCPFCGGDQTMRPCGACGEALDAGWVFCIGCGSPAADG